MLDSFIHSMHNDDVMKYQLNDMTCQTKMMSNLFTHEIVNLDYIMIKEDISKICEILLKQTCYVSILKTIPLEMLAVPA